MAARKRNTTQETASRPKRARAKTAAKKAPQFEARIGDEKLVEAAKRAGDAWREAVAKRNEAIKAAVKGGTSARQVAIAVGLTHAAVLKIVK
jgi:hypothetical protein